MRIGIDISALAYPDVGVSNVVRGLNESLANIAKNDDLVFFYSSLRRPLKSDLINVKKFRIPPALLELIWNRLHILKVENFVGEVNLFHSSDWTQPPSKSKKITTIHDLAPLKFPQEFHPKIVKVHTRRIEWVKKEVDRIVCVSQSTKQDVINMLGIDESMLRVVPNAPSSIFKKSNEEEVKKTKAKLGINDDYILTVGSISPRKNMNRLIDAFGKLNKNYDYKLVIVGQYVWGEKIRNTSNIIVLGKVPNEELVALYSGAKIFVYPSLYEGFGIPILEAMACGTPVATSNTSAMPEVAGDAAVFFDPYSTGSIFSSLERLLTSDNLRVKLARLGLKRAENFSWKRSAQMVLSIYHEFEK